MGTHPTAAATIITLVKYHNTIIVPVKAGRSMYLPRGTYTMARLGSHIRMVKPDTLSEPRQQNRVNLFDLAYQVIEDLLVNGALRPGCFLTMQDLQDITGFGRTPVHHAVSRLAADTLILIRPRHGLQIAPINLGRERVLLHLRRDIERFVIRLATSRSDTSQRNQLLRMECMLRNRRGRLTLAEFNMFDRDIDRLILAAANEPFLEHTLRPLHTLFRRIGYIFHTHVPGNSSLDNTVDRHLAVLTAVAGGQAGEAVAASDALMDFVDGMFDVMKDHIEPELLDSSAEPTAGHFAVLGSSINPVVRTGLQQRTTA
jgi:DNA-binding GntR family transcriptional regulator